MNSFADFHVLAANSGQGERTWQTGDFNRDGTTNLGDFHVLAANFGLSAAGPDLTPEDWASLASAVPEPSAACLATVTLAARVRRRRAGSRRSSVTL